MRMHTCCFDGARCSDSLGMPSARSAACHSANQFLSACSCAACFCCSRCCSAAAAASCCCEFGGFGGFGGRGGQGFHGGEGGDGDGGSGSNHPVDSGVSGVRCCFACTRTGSHASSSSGREPPAFA